MTKALNRVFSWLILAVVTSILLICWAALWHQGGIIRDMEAEITGLRGDVAEAMGDVDDAQLELEYFRKYSFEVVMEILIKKASEHNVPINVALALMHIESYFNPFAISSTGDWGLYQINEYVWKFDKRKILDPEFNIDFGLRYLRKCRDHAGSWSMGLALYNAGKYFNKSEHPRKFSESIFMK
jgi:hypothetical protein